MLASTIYDAYSGSDLLCIPEPDPAETISDYLKRVVKPKMIDEDALDDSLFYFICAELSDMEMDNPNSNRQSIIALHKAIV
jgi:hypothetical protein